MNELNADQQPDGCCCWDRQVNRASGVTCSSCIVRDHRSCYSRLRRQAALLVEAK